MIIKYLSILRILKTKLVEPLSETVDLIYNCIQHR